MNKLAHFQQYKSRYEVVFLFCYFFINATILATSVVLEAQRNHMSTFKLWEPFVWEYTSALSTLVLFPLIVLWFKKCPFQWDSIKRYCLFLLLAALVFSFAHTGIMVVLRKVIYISQSMNYDFGDLSFEFVYEIRKDIWSFIFFIAGIYAYGFIVSQLQGEANPVAVGEDDSVHKKFERLIVRKLGKEFIIKVEDIEWLESAGNYVNLHIKDRIYPIRATLGQLVSRIESKGFCRIHRSHGIKLDLIESITPLSSGDSEVLLSTGKRLNLSRRYKDSFKATL